MTATNKFNICRIVVSLESEIKFWNIKGIDDIYQKRAEKDKRDEIGVCQIGAALLVLDDDAVLELEAARVARSPFDARQHDIGPSLARRASLRTHTHGHHQQISCLHSI